MKMFKNGLVIFLFLFSLAACNRDDNNDRQGAASKKIKIEKMVSFQDAEIGILEGKKVNVMVSKNQILSFAEEALKDTKLNLKPYDYKIIEENNTKYLRVYSNNNYVSTAELTVNQNGVLKVGKTVCTSTQCASGGGCVPNGLYCTSCTPPNAPGVPGDCVRTTSGE